ncbi:MULTISPECIES: hypothetical protein [Calothrix]|uniref:SAM domain-containing protein n=2 Tax=Calothrix TaxID=1186 RepID=A0ABR8AKQ3_9CYAN|nr:hypothetical protein [Calothrix parietina]MBD2200364.1 hypothetical protein [Calothrix parietina FACHB-288]MBD2229002.1 hypothetical protein [Calothrix anomala FACHB-343]
MFNNLNNQSHTTDNFNQLQWIDLYSELGINQYLNLFANSDASWNKLHTVFGRNVEC